jgi:hypothetical protein
MHLKKLIFLLLLFYIPSAFAQSTLVCNTGGSSYTVSGGQLIGTHQYPTACYYYYTNFGYSGSGSNGGNPTNGGSTGPTAMPAGTPVNLVSDETACQFNWNGTVSNADQIQSIAETTARQLLGRDFLPSDTVRLTLTGNPDRTDTFNYVSYSPGSIQLLNDTCRVIRHVGNGGPIP